MGDQLTDLRTMMATLQEQMRSYMESVESRFSALAPPPLQAFVNLNFKLKVIKKYMVHTYLTSILHTTHYLTIRIQWQAPTTSASTSRMPLPPISLLPPAYQQPMEGGASDLYFPYQ